MNWTKTITAAAFISASIATPALAQATYGSGAAAPYERGPQTYYRSYDVPPGSYEPRGTDEYWNERNFGFSGRDPSRTGGVTPNLKPSGS